MTWMSRVVPLLLIASAGCGKGVTDADGAAAPSAAAPTSAEEQCLAAAGAPRTPKAGSPDKVSFKQILIHSVASKRPKEGVTRSREQACLRAAEARDKMKAGGDFDALVDEYSDEAGASSRAGLSSGIPVADLVPPVADAALALDVMQMSDVVESEHGFHLILRVP